MIYPKNYEEKIGFNNIRKIIAENCLCQLGREHAEKMDFTSNGSVIRKRIRQTTEFMEVINNEEFPEHNFIDMREPLKRIRIEKVNVGLMRSWVILVQCLIEKKIKIP